MTADSTFILRTLASGSGIRLAVKDLIAIEGLPMTAGCKAIADVAEPAQRDAACMAGARAAGAQIVGLTSLNELAFGASGINEFFGTPINPVDPQRIPGGSSSGSAVAVAVEDADIAYGSDTTGSIRIPAACCGVVGLKTTVGRVPLDGVYPLSATLDTVGPMGRDVAAVAQGMTLLEPGFRVVEQASFVVGRFRLPTDALIDAAIDRVLGESGVSVTEITLPDWDAANDATRTIANYEGWQVNADLVHRSSDKLGAATRESFAFARRITVEQFEESQAVRREWRESLRKVFSGVDIIAMPTLTQFPPTLQDADGIWSMLGTRAWSLAGVPALALPLPTTGPMPASLQVIAPWGAEDRLLAAGALFESASARHP